MPVLPNDGLVPLNNNWFVIAVSIIVQLEAAKWPRSGRRSVRKKIHICGVTRIDQAGVKLLRDPHIELLVVVTLVAGYTGSRHTNYTHSHPAPRARTRWLILLSHDPAPSRSLLRSCEVLCGTLLFWLKTKPFLWTRGTNSQNSQCRDNCTVQAVLGRIGGNTTPIECTISDPPDNSSNSSSSSQ